MIIKNWRENPPFIAHRSGIDWRLLSEKGAEVPDHESACLRAMKFVSLAWLQPGLSYEPHSHPDHEEIYYIISGKGTMRIDDEKRVIRDGDIIYIPINGVHEIINDGDEMIKFLAFAADVK